MMVGNYFFPSESGYSDEAFQIASGDILSCEKNEHLYKPIPINEEWFDRLDPEEFEFVGFGTRIIYQHKTHKSIQYELAANDQLFVTINGGIINVRNFIHDWQNIHFALCQLELKFIE